MLIAQPPTQKRAVTRREGQTSVRHFRRLRCLLREHEMASPEKTAESATNHQPGAAVPGIASQAVLVKHIYFCVRGTLIDPDEMVLDCRCNRKNCLRIHLLFVAMISTKA